MKTHWLNIPEKLKRSPFFDKSHQIAFLSALAILIITLPIVRFGNQWHRTNQIRQKQTQVTAELEVYANAFSSLLKQQFSLLLGMQTFAGAYTANPSVLQTTFESTAPVLYNSIDNIDCIILSPGGVNTHIYPTAGNRELLGVDLFQIADPIQQSDLQQAIRQKEPVLTVLTNPDTSSQTVIARLAVFEEESQSLWGFVSVFIDITPIFQDNGILTPPSDLKLAIKDQSGQMLYGQAQVFEQQPVIYSVDLANKTWQFAAFPKDGWRGDAMVTLTGFYVTEWLVVILLAGIVYLVVEKQVRLTLSVKGQVKEITSISRQLNHQLVERSQMQESLQKSEAQFRYITDVLPLPIAITKATGQILYINRQFEKTFGYTLQDISTTQLWFQQAYPDQAYRQIVMDDWQQTMVDSPDGVSFRTFNVTCKNGDVRAVIFRLVFLEDNRLMILCEDVTARKRAEESLRQRYRELVWLNQVGQTLISVLDLDTALPEMLKEIREMLNVAAGAIWLVDVETGQVTCRRADGQLALFLQDKTLVPGKGMVGWVVENQENLNISNVQVDNYFQENCEVDKQALLAIGSVLTVPLKIGNTVTGAIQFFDTDINRFTPSDVALIEALATTCAVVIDNARLYKQAKEDAETKSILLKEVNHRIKNNFASIIGFLYTERRYALQKQNEGTYCGVMQDLINRVQGLATVHNLLSVSQWSSLVVSELAQHVTRNALQFQPIDKDITVKITPASVRVNAHQANALALILNELVTNTLKYGFKDRKSGCINVKITSEGNTIALVFADDGIGYPENVLLLKQYNVGLYLVQNIIQNNLHGMLLLYNDHGATAKISFEAVEDVPHLLDS